MHGPVRLEVMAASEWAGLGAGPRKEGDPEGQHVDEVGRPMCEGHHSRPVRAGQTLTLEWLYERTNIGAMCQLWRIDETVATEM